MSQIEAFEKQFYQSMIPVSFTSRLRVFARNYLFLASSSNRQARAGLKTPQLQNLARVADPCSGERRPCFTHRRAPPRRLRHSDVDQQIDFIEQHHPSLASLGTPLLN